MSEDEAWKEKPWATLNDQTKSVPHTIILVALFLVALFQFLKAGFLFYLFLQFWHGYSGWAASGRPDSPILQNFLDKPFIVLFPALSVVFVAIGWGLLNLKAWLRGYLIGAIICTWIGGRFGSHPTLDALFFSNGVDLRHQHFRILVCVFLLDLFVFLSLVFYPDIAKTFGEEED